MLERFLIRGGLAHLHSLFCVFTFVESLYCIIPKRRGPSTKQGEMAPSKTHRSSARMATNGIPTVYKEAEPRKHLRDTLKDLPNNLPKYNQTQLLGTISTLEHFKVHAEN
jgi:hypothetical protein